MERRTFLVLGAAAVGLAGCTRGAVEPSPPSEPVPSTAPGDPDSRLRDEVTASEVALIAAYRTAIAAHPQLAAELEPLLAHHEEHVSRVAPGFEFAPGTPSPSASATAPAGSASPSESESAAPAGSGAPDESATPVGSLAPDASAGPDAPLESRTGEPPAAKVLTDLAAAESGAQSQRASACNGAQDPALVRDLCLIAASEAQHAVVLADLAAQEPGS